jgi:two-component system chemotaxis sensor kinase CheA
MGMLLQGGISTTPRPTELSGRGIGLDVVRETVSRLKGTVTARTESGQGTTIEISIPVSIESVEVLHVQTGGERVSIPLQAVRRAMRVGESDVARSGRSESIVCDGQTLPLVSLAGILQRENGSADHSQPITALVLDVGSGAAAVGVDHLLGKQRVVVRSLPGILGSLPGVIGAFFDSEGDPQLVLDPAGLIQMAHSGVGVSAAVEPAARPPLLIVDDSLTTRMLEQGILEAAGYEVDTAASGEEALRKARQRRYGLFLVDVEMPGMSGFEFIETSLADPRLRQVPSIVVTSRDSDEDRARGDRLGAKAYIVKSRFDEELLLQRIRELVG